MKYLFLLFFLTGCASTMETPARPPTPHEKRTIEMYKDTDQEHRLMEYWEELKEREK